MNAAHPSPVRFLLRQRLVIATVLAVIALACVNWLQDPSQAARWLSGMIRLPAVCLLFAGWAAWAARRRPAATADDAEARLRYFGAALSLVVIAVGMHQIVKFGLQIWVRFGDHGADIEFERRILGIATAVVYLVLGNTLPKILTPLSILPVDLAHRQTRARRFVGTVLVLLGATLAIAFVGFPLEAARTLERWSIVPAMFALFAAIVWMNMHDAGRKA